MEPTLVYHLVGMARDYGDDKKWHGKTVRASSLSKEKLLDLIEKYPSYIAEGYYEFLVIEAVQLDVFDGYVFVGMDDEPWFEYVKDGDDWKYIPCPRPKKFKNTCYFSGG